MPEVAFVGETYPHRSLNVSAQRTLNLYPELISDDGAKKQHILVGTPGSIEFADLSSETSASCRGLHFTSTSMLYAVYGQKLMRIGSDGSIVESYLISGGSTPVSMADNGKYLLFADGQNIFQLEMDTGLLVTQNGLPFTAPQMIKYIGQRFVSFGKNSNQFWWSAVGPDGPLTWEGTAFASAEGSADDINALAVSDGELVLFGPRSYEVFRLVADDDAPFGRVNGSFTDIGCGAPYSVAEIMGKVFWIGSSTVGKNQVFMLDGYNAKPISNHAISTLLDTADRSAPKGQVNTTSDARGFTYQQNGHIFYVMNLIQANKTLVYDVMGQWHERSSRDPLYNIENRWEPTWAVFAHERVLCGNGKVPKILELDLDVYTEYDGRQIKRQRISPIYWDDMAWLFHKDFVLDMETGVGLTNASLQGHDPQAMLRFSDDSGHTWSSEKWRPIGKVGGYGTRVKWNKLGKARNRVYEITITDPIKVVMLGASLRTVKGIKR